MMKHVHPSLAYTPMVAGALTQHGNTAEGPGGGWLK